MPTMTAEEYNAYMEKALAVAAKGLVLPGGVTIKFDPKVELIIPTEWDNPERAKVYQQFAEDLQIIFNAMQLQIHMMAGSVISAPTIPTPSDHFPMIWMQEYLKWYKDVVAPTKKAMEEAALEVESLVEPTSFGGTLRTSEETQ